MNIKSFIVPVAAAASLGLVGLITNVQPVNANTWCSSIGSSTYCDGPGQSSFNTQSIGGTTFYDGTDRHGNSYSGSCMSIGSSVWCD